MDKVIHILLINMVIIALLTNICGLRCEYVDKNDVQYLSLMQRIKGLVLHMIFTYYPYEKNNYPQIINNMWIIKCL